MLPIPANSNPVIESSSAMAAINVRSLAAAADCDGTEAMVVDEGGGRANSDRRWAMMLPVTLMGMAMMMLMMPSLVATQVRATRQRIFHVI